MQKLFYLCKSLKKLNISNFNFNKVIYMNSMFFGCPEGLKRRIRAQFKDLREVAFIGT